MDEEGLQLNNYILEKHNQVSSYMTNMNDNWDYDLRRQLTLIRDTIIPAPSDPNQSM